MAVTTPQSAMIMLELRMPKGVYQKTADHGRALSRALQGNQNRRRHGESTRSKQTPEHMAWQNMRARCQRPSHPSYKNYGGRGITICARWDVFENFLTDMGRRPGTGFSLGRINNDGNYEPGNCRWETTAEQAGNKRESRMPHAKLTLQDRDFILRNSGVMSQRAIANLLGVSQALVSRIVRRGA